MNANSDPVARKVMQNVPFVLVAVFGVWASCCSVVTADQDKAPSASPLRRPVAMALLGNARLCVGNRRSGSVSLLDTESLQVVSEFTCCELLADLIALPDSRHLLAVDEATHKLILLVHEGDALRVASECRVAPYPVSVRVSGDGTKCCVASLWSRTLTTVDLVVSPDGGLVVAAAISFKVTMIQAKQLFGYEDDTPL